MSHKALSSLDVLTKGLTRMLDNIQSIDPSYADIVTCNLETLLTTLVENIRAVSHFKHETFSFLQYGVDLETIVKESMKRITSWSAKYYTYDKSYYPVPQSFMPLSAVASRSPLLPETISKENEANMREWLENYRPVRQRTVRSETTKDKTGALPPAVYSKTSNTTESTSKVSFVEEIDRSTPIDHESEEEKTLLML